MRTRIHVETCESALRSQATLANSASQKGRPRPSRLMRWNTVHLATSSASERIAGRAQGLTPLPFTRCPEQSRQSARCACRWVPADPVPRRIAVACWRRWRLQPVSEDRGRPLAWEPRLRPKSWRRHGPASADALSRRRYGSAVPAAARTAGRCTADIFDARYAVLAEFVIAFGVDYGAFSFGLVWPRSVDIVVLSRCLADLQAQHHERSKEIFPLCNKSFNCSYSGHAIFATKSVVENSQVSKILEAGKLKLTEQSAALRGVADKMAVFQILWTPAWESGFPPHFCFASR